MRLNPIGLLAAFALLAAVTACAPNIARNGFAEVYSGPSQTEGDKVETGQPVPFNLPEPANRDADYRSSLTADDRFGMWFTEWGGVALDGPYFQAGGIGVNNTVVSATPLLLLRMRLLKSGSVPNGQLQPYFSIGPGIFFTDQKADFRQDISRRIDTAHMSVGVDLRAGMRWQLSSKLGVFGEYRMTRYKTNGGNHDKTVFFSEENSDATLTTSHIMSGLTIAF